ncbi:cell division inhibitor SulA [Teredinibacter waterburyi]|jgi:SOS-response cell division inhibitor, blocks FtsZ ring formation|uniref:cell division inhibitor SulA n=1 Tax=Teredinibacter waterburyi TaxID=1500538 RepID=UPI00165F2CD8|nr:SulA-like leucine-rich domain-containing protein [Teredinibacter waterburyi]
MEQIKIPICEASLNNTSRADITRDPASNQNAGVTEIVLSHNSAQVGYELVLPMLAHQSRNCEDRWFTWVAPENVSKSLLQQYGFDLRKVRLIHTKSDIETLWVLWDALQNGNSAMVVGSLREISSTDCAKLEDAACQGDTQGLLLRVR